ncbi:hypothetical protein DQM23_10210 [Lacticaseibacillus paracasei]|nr:hypothetical protein DQM24_05290 [Lacticaseibacillus paracasei]RDF90281.1 hypothetical protein DQM23_10210 [Lacticaseibacillus paracasei]
MQTTQRPGLELMLLGDFETGLWARSAVTAFQPHLAGDCGVWHGKGFYSLDLY